jgi:hypothetical protein
MSQLDSEINSLRLRLAALEEQKRIADKKAFPMKTLEKIIDEHQYRIEHDSYCTSLPLARFYPLAKFYDKEKVAFLEPILNALKDIQERLDVLEDK